MYESGRQYMKYVFAIRMKSERRIRTPFVFFFQIHCCPVRNRGGVFSDAEPDTVTFEKTNIFFQISFRRQQMCSLSFSIMKH